MILAQQGNIPKDMLWISPFSLPKYTVFSYDVCSLELFCVIMIAGCSELWRKD